MYTDNNSVHQDLAAEMRSSCPGPIRQCYCLIVQTDLLGQGCDTGAASLLHLSSSDPSRFAHFHLSFLMMTMERTQSVGPVTLLIMPFSSIRSNSAFTAFSRALGTLRGAVTVGFTPGWRWMWYSPGSLPMPLQTSGNSWSTASYCCAAVWWAFLVASICIT